MQYFIKNKDQIKAEDLPYLTPEKKFKMNDYPDVIFGTKLTDSQYRNAKMYGTVTIQRESRKYAVSIKMIRKELTHKIRSYV